ncbi:MAG: hypothetical protein PIR02_00380 [Microbacterium enclense]
MDPDALRVRPRGSEVRRFWTGFVAEHPQVGGGPSLALRVIAVGSTAVVGVLAALVISGIIAYAAGASPYRADAIGRAMPSAIVLGILFLFLLWISVRLVRGRSRLRRHWALAHFADANGLVYEPGAATGYVPGWGRRPGEVTVLGAVRSRAGVRPSRAWADLELRDRMSSAYTSVQRVGMIGIGLARPAPDLVLRPIDEATASLPEPRLVARNAVIGDGDHAAVLFCAPDDADAAREFFTPGLRRLIGEGWQIETSGTAILLIRRAAVVTIDPAEWSRLLETADAAVAALAPSFRDDGSGAAPAAAGVIVTRDRPARRGPSHDGREIPDHASPRPTRSAPAAAASSMAVAGAPAVPQAEPAHGARTLNLDALHARPHPGEVRAFWAELQKEVPRVRDPENRGRRRLALILTTSCSLLVLGLGAGVIDELRTTGWAAPDQLFGRAMLLLGSAGVLVFSVWLLVRTNQRRTSPRTHWTLTRFADDNAMEYIPGPRSGTLRAWRDRAGHTAARIMRMQTRTGRGVEWADYEVRRFSIGFTYGHFGGWIAIRLGRPLPHIVLRATDRGTRRFSMGYIPDAAQRLSLEGDFDEHFELYCPAGYEQDALYLFTPDVMSRAIDGAGGWDIEIVDDTLLLVNPRDVVTTDPERWIEVTRTADAFAAKIDRWERWRDDRVESTDAALTDGLSIDAGDVDVAPAGRRLRTSWTFFAWLSLIALAAFLIGGLVLGKLLS